MTGSTGQASVSRQDGNLPSRVSRHTGTLALLAFSLSGCAGLIYQSVWAQYLGLFLGHAAYAQSLVLAIFMGGMASGAWWAGARTTHRHNLLRAYAWVELGIGAAGLVFHPIYTIATRFAYDSAFPTLASNGEAAAFKWALAAALIFPQSALLGATFPLMSNALMRRLPAGNGAILGGLYFTNSIGAAVGALLATFVLLPAVGLPGAMLSAAVLNLVVAAAAFVLAGSKEPSPRGSAGAAIPGLRTSTLLASAAFITGATSFVYEIGWVRMLSLAFGSTLHAFELMLAAFVGGLALGGLWIRSRIDRYAQPLRAGGYVQVLMGIAALASLLLYNQSFDWVAWCMRIIPKTDDGYALFNVATGAGAIVIMAPTAFFAGMTLPLFTLELIRRGGGEASVGRVYAANTVGAIVGVLVAVHALLPIYGLKQTMIVAAVGDLALGLFLLWRTRAQRPILAYAVVVVLCAFAVATAMSLARFDPMAMAAGVYRGGAARLDSSIAQVIFYGDGKTASIASTKLVDGSVMISTNGKVDASIQLRNDAPPTVDELTMTMAALLPLAMQADPHSAAVIGFGSGLTTQILLSDPRLTSVDTIEIEPKMVEGAKAFAARVPRAFEDPRSHVIFDDAKSYFAANQSRYDIIVSEPSNPWVSGVASLFSKEFYRFIPRHLKPSGLFVQWIQVYGINDELVASIGNALSDSFTDFRVYFANDFDMLLIATPTGSLGEVHGEIFQQPSLASQLRRVGMFGTADVDVREAGNRRSLVPLFEAVSRRSNSDFYPILSLEAPRARFIDKRALMLLGLGTADAPVREVLAGIQPPPAERLSPSPTFTPAELTRQAAEIASALGEAEPSAAGHDPAIFAAARSVRADFAACDNRRSAADEIDVLIALGGRTIPFLDAGHLKGIWSEPHWIACEMQAESSRAVLALLSALGQRQFGVVQPKALALLQAHRGELSPMAQDWLLRIAMLSAIAESRYDDVAGLEASLGGQIPPTDSSKVQRIYLTAFAAARTEADAGLHVMQHVPAAGAKSKD